MALGDTNFIFSCWQMLSALEDKIRIPARPCNILYIRATKATKKWITKTGSQYQKRSHASFKQQNNNMALATTLNNTS